MRTFFYHPFIRRTSFKKLLLLLCQVITMSYSSFKGVRKKNWRFIQNSLSP